MRNLFQRNCLDFILEKIKKDNLFQLFHDFEVGVGDICFIARGKDLTEVSHTWVASPPPPPPFQGTLFSICFSPWESNWSVFIYSFFFLCERTGNVGAGGGGEWGQSLSMICAILSSVFQVSFQHFYSPVPVALFVNITLLHSVYFLWFGSKKTPKKNKCPPLQEK